MSHFSVLVIGEDHEKQLAPYHEFECTNINDEHVAEIDKTDELREEWRSGTTRRLRDPAGGLHCPYGDNLYRPATVGEAALIREKGTNSGLSFDRNHRGGFEVYRVREFPEGWVEVELPRPEVETFLEYLEGDYGYEGRILRPGERPRIGPVEIPRGAEHRELYPHRFGWVELGAAGEVVRVIDRTNENKRWDWWVVGGRWGCKLKLKPGAKGVVRQKKGGLFGADDLEPTPGYADQALKGDVDWDGMRWDGEVKARAFWKRTREITGGLGWETFEDAKLRFVTARDPETGEATGHDYDKAREFFWTQPAVELLTAHDKEKNTHTYTFGFDHGLALDEEEYVRRGRDAACSFFAFLKDGRWEERGSMGWFASVSGGVSEGQWHARINAEIDALPDDVMVCVVDCHI